MAKTKKQAPWWLERGTETCSVCGQTYAPQMESRCADCDAPLCPCCADPDGEGACRCEDCCAAGKES
jgi:hypothetical protein